MNFTFVANAAEALEALFPEGAIKPRRMPRATKAKKK